MKTGTTLLAAAGLLALGACTNSTPAENASRNISEAAGNVAEELHNVADNARNEIAAQTDAVRDAAGNAANVIDERAGRVREATGNSMRDLGNAVNGR